MQFNYTVDSFYCSQPATFISAVLLTASTMMRLAMPHVNVLSKVDLLSKYGKLPFNLGNISHRLSYYILTVPFYSRQISTRNWMI